MTTRWHKKLVSYSFIAILSIILVSNMFITLWILTAIGKELALKITNNTYQGQKGMPEQEISVQNKDKQPKNLKKLKIFLLNFLNFQTKINFEKKFP